MCPGLRLTTAHSVIVVHSHLPKNDNSFITLLLFSLNSQGLIME